MSKVYHVIEYDSDTQTARSGVQGEVPFPTTTLIAALASSLFDVLMRQRMANQHANPSQQPQQPRPKIFLPDGSLAPPSA